VEVPEPGPADVPEPSPADAPESAPEDAPEPSPEDVSTEEALSEVSDAGEAENEPAEKFTA
jgi:hypothetical protein